MQKETIKGKFYDAVWNETDEVYYIDDQYNQHIVGIRGRFITFYKDICDIQTDFGDVEDIMHLITTVVYFNRKRNDTVLLSRHNISFFSAS